MTMTVLVFCCFMLVSFLIKPVKCGSEAGRCYWITEDRYSKDDIPDDVCPGGMIASNFNLDLVNFLETNLGNQISIENRVFVDVRRRDGEWRNLDNSVLNWNWITSSGGDSCDGNYNFAYVYMYNSKLGWGASQCYLYHKVLCSAEFWGPWSSYGPDICPESEQRNRTRSPTGKPWCHLLIDSNDIGTEQIEFTTCSPKRLDILVSNNGRLKNHQYDSFEVYTMATCAMHCRQQKGVCLSINYNRETHACDLNDVTMVLHSSDVSVEDDWVNFEFMADETDDGNSTSTS